jgi:poly(hydroxyalkanoate) granule-associated protein
MNGKAHRNVDLHDLWLAGVGVVARAEEEGRALFEELVEKGRKVEVRQFKAIDRTVARTSERVRELGERVQERVEDGAQGLLHRLGLPTREDFETLSGRIAALAKKVDQVAGERP